MTGCSEDKLGDGVSRDCATDLPVGEFPQLASSRPNVAKTLNLAPHGSSLVVLEVVLLARFVNLTSDAVGVGSLLAK